MRRHFRKWLSTASLGQRRMLAAKAKVSLSFLRELAHGRRNAAADVALRIEQAALQLEMDPPVLREHLCAACKGCDVLKASRAHR